MLLKTDDLSVTLGKKEIVHQAGIQVRNGEFVGLIGPNGSGKTTLLKSIYRVLKPSGGVTTLDGQDIQSMSHKQSAQVMGVVSQFNNLSFDFTVEEIVLMGRSPHKNSFSRDSAEDFSIVEDCLRRVNMLEFRDRSFLTLSGGEKQRILLARALAQQVEILVLDEPTNHLDIKYQIQIMDVVKESGVGVLAALHDLNLTLMYCTYLYVLKGGNIIAHGKPEEIIREDLIREVYEVDCQVLRHPQNGQMYVVYFSRQNSSK